MPTPVSPFQYHHQTLHAEGVPLADIAQAHGTPCYVYSRRRILDCYDQYRRALEGRSALVCFAVKANGNLGVLRTLADAGCGFDIVSGGELARARAAGAPADRIVFSGVGKTAAEIDYALREGIACFNVESVPELHAIDAVARRLGRRAPVSLRINPDVDPLTHPYISTGLKDNKFGIPARDAVAVYREAAGMAGLEAVGIDCHIGSQITQLSPYLEAADRLLDLVDAIESAGIRLRHVDFGGGLGIVYRDDTPPDIGAYVSALLARLDRRGRQSMAVYLEPGRSLVGDAGVLLTRVEYLKTGETRDFAIVDAAMNDLLRPTLYDAWMNVVPVRPRQGEAREYDIVGPVCESGDWLARERSLCLEPGDLLAIECAGAYGMSMSSNYNSRGRAAEVLVDGKRASLVRRRETIDDQLALERDLPAAG